MNQLKSKRQKSSSNLQNDSMSSRHPPGNTSIQISNTSLEDSVSRDESMKENDDIIKVFVRVKPDIKTQDSSRKLPTPENSLKFRNNQTIQVVNSSREIVKSFTYEQILSEKMKQEEVFMVAAAPLIKHAIMGYNSTIFVYGQTGTGKTYTMGLLNEIDEESKGIIPLSLKYLFEYFEEVKSREGDSFQWELSVSLIQIYLDNVMDLLNPKGDSLAIREDPDTKETYLQDLTTVPVTNIQQTMALVNAGLVARAQASQRMNQTSSRSHLIIMFNIHQEFIDSNNKRTQLFSQLTMIDLAGSERVRKTISSGLRLEEAKSINTSLNALGNVIAALRNTSKPFIPYRASKLTRILQNSLSGDAKISLIATISKCPSNLNETISTLQFASRCRDIQLKPQINQIQDYSSEEEVEDLTNQMESVDDTENSIRGVNYDSMVLHERQESMKSVNKDQLRDQREYMEILEYMMKLLPNLKRFLAEKIPEIFVVRENFMTEMLEELRAKLGTVRGNMSKTEAQTYLKRHEFLEELDKRYPRHPEELPADEEDKSEISLMGQPPDSMLENVQKMAKFFIDGVNALTNNSLNLERLKLEMLEKEMKDLEATTQINQLTKLVDKLVRHNKDLYNENIDLKYPHMHKKDRFSLLNDKNQELINLVKTVFTDKRGEARSSDLLDKILNLSAFEKEVRTRPKSQTHFQNTYENPRLPNSQNRLDNSSNALLTSFSMHQKDDRSNYDSANLSTNNLTTNTLQNISYRAHNPTKSQDLESAFAVLQNLKLDVIEEAAKDVKDQRHHRNKTIDSGRIEPKVADKKVYSPFQNKGPYLVGGQGGIHERVDTVNYMDSSNTRRSIQSPTGGKGSGDKENMFEGGGSKSEALRNILRKNNGQDEGEKRKEAESNVSSVGSRKSGQQENLSQQIGVFNVNVEEGRMRALESQNMNVERIIGSSRGNAGDVKQGKEMEHARAKSFGGGFVMENMRKQGNVEEKSRENEGFLPGKDKFEEEEDESLVVEEKVKIGPGMGSKGRYVEGVPKMMGKKMEEKKEKRMDPFDPERAITEEREESSYQQGKERSMENVQDDDERWNDDFFKQSQGEKFSVNESFRKDMWDKNMKEDVFESFAKRPEQSFAVEDWDKGRGSQFIQGKKDMRLLEGEKDLREIYLNEQKKTKDVKGEAREGQQERRRNFEDLPVEPKRLESGQKYHSSGHKKIGEFSDQKVPLENNYFSLSVKEAQSILKDDLTEDASPAKFDVGGENMIGGGEGEEYWSFSKKEVQQMKSPPQPNMESVPVPKKELLQTMEVRKVEPMETLEEKKEVETKKETSLGFPGKIVKESNEKNVMPRLALIQNLNETREERAEISQRDVSPTTSRNYSFDSLSSNRFASAREFPQSQKMNLSKFKDITKKSAPYLKSFRGRGHSHNNSMVDNMSLNELSMSLERVNPKKYEDGTSTSMLERSEGLGDKSFEEGLPSNIKKVYDEKKGKDGYIGYLMDSFRSRKKSPVDHYKLKDKMIEFNSKPILPKMTKVVGNVSLRKESEGEETEKKGLGTGQKVLDLSGDRLKNLFKNNRMFGNAGK